MVPEALRTPQERRLPALTQTGAVSQAGDFFLNLPPRTLAQAHHRDDLPTRPMMIPSMVRAERTLLRFRALSEIFRIIQ